MTSAMTFSGLGPSALSTSARITSRHHSPTVRPRASARFSSSAYSSSVTLAPADRVRNPGIGVPLLLGLDARRKNRVLAKSTSYRTAPRQRWTALQTGKWFVLLGCHIGTSQRCAAPILGWRVTPSADAKHRLSLRTLDTARQRR
jgi:hypothetical protein